MKIRASAAFLLLVSSGCMCDRGQGVSAQREGPAPSPGETAAVADATNALGWGLYEQLAATADRANLVCSPASAHLTLAILEAGADGGTRDELLNRLGDTEAGLQRVVSYSLRSWLARAGEAHEIHVASQVFVDRGSPLRPDFEASIRAHFGAGVTAVDFRRDPASSSAAIEAWMSETRKRANAAVPVGPLTRLVAVSSLRFEAAWARRFGATSDGTFRRADGEEVIVPMMRLGAELPYAEVDGARVVELRYAGSRFGLILVRPRGSEGLATLGGSIERLDAWVAALEPHAVELMLPKFRLEPRALNLAPALQELGLARAFDRRVAEFGRMVEGDELLFIETVVQRVALQVDERGTQAAATTTAVIVPASASPVRVNLRFDRPFLFLLRDRETGVVLFLGRVGDPSRG